MSEPYIPEEDRIDVTKRLVTNLDETGEQTLREKAEAAASEEVAAEGLPKELQTKTIEDIDKDEVQEAKMEEDQKLNKDEKDHKDGGGKDDTQEAANAPGSSYEAPAPSVPNESPDRPTM